VGILLPKERYWEIPETEEIKIKVLETTRFQDKDEGRIQKASNVDDEIQDIKRNLDKGRKEMKEIALGLCVRHRAPRRIRGSSYPTSAHEPLKKIKQHPPPAPTL